MKLEKHGLFKLVGIILVIAVLLTWLAPSATFSQGELVTNEFSRVGLFDLTTYGLLGFNYFPFIFIFLLVVGGFYNFISKTDAYQEMTRRIAKVFSNKALYFTIVSMVVYGLLSSIVTDYLVLFALVPLTISVAAKMNSTKLSAFVSSFGGILLGILASTLNGSVAGLLTSTFALTMSATEYIAIGVIFVIGGLLLGYLVSEDLKKNGSNEEKQAVDIFAVEKKEEVEKVANKKSAKVVKKVARVNTVPMAIVYVVTIVLSLLAFINWSAIGVTLFDDIHSYITEATIAGVPVFEYILGSTVPKFGAWTLFGVSGLLFIATVILSIIYKIKFDTIVDGYLEGFKKIGKTVLLVFVIYIVLETTYFFPVLPTITNAIYELFGNNIATYLTTSALQSVFSVEFQYTLEGVSGLLATIGAETPAIVALATQFAYGLVSFVAPTSVMLATGLTVLGINIKEYFKFIWKFIVAMTIVVVVMLVILTLI